VTMGSAPGNARLDVTRTATLVTATVSARLSLPGLTSFLPTVMVHAHVTDALEPTSSAAPRDGAR
jgi:hypothetical protein